MAHRSGGGSHSGGYYSSHGGSGGSSSRYSNKPFPNARRFRYYDRHGRERYLYGSQMPQRSSLFSLIFSLIFFIPFIFGSIYSVVSLLHVMNNHNSGDAVAAILFVIVWNTFIFFAISAVIKSYIRGRRDYQEVPIEGSANTVPGAMGGNNTAYQNRTTFQNGTAYQSGAGTVKKYMYYDKNGNKKYDSVSYSYRMSSALMIMIIVLIIAVPMLIFDGFLLFGLIWMTVNASNAEVASGIMPMLIGSSIWIVAVITGIVCAVRHYTNVKKRQYFEVSNDGSVDYGNNNTAQYSGTQYYTGMQYNGTQYNTGMQYNGTQYNTGMQYNGAQYNAAGAADSDYFNDDSRFRGPEYYDDDARYRGSTAYEAGKK